MEWTFFLTCFFQITLAVITFILLVSFSVWAGEGGIGNYFKRSAEPSGMRFNIGTIIILIFFLCNLALKIGIAFFLCNYLWK